MKVFRSIVVSFDVSSTRYFVRVTKGLSFVHN